MNPQNGGERFPLKQSTTHEVEAAGEVVAAVGGAIAADQLAARDETATGALAVSAAGADGDGEEMVAAACSEAGGVPSHGEGVGAEGEEEGEEDDDEEEEGGMEGEEEEEEEGEA